MSWTERQQAMLQEIGIRLWLPPEAQPAADAVPTLPAPASEQVAAPVAPRMEPSVQPVPMVARGARPTGVEQMDWAALRDAVAGCTACKLCQSRKNTVFGVGSEEAHWMVVGEAPGEQEDKQGEPFVGKAGQLLDNMLAAIGLSRGEPAPVPGEGPAGPERRVFIANVLKCRPPGNRNPEPEEVAQCEPFLRRQVELVKPRIILAMGRFAVQSLLQTTEPIGRLRGKPHRYAGVPVIVTYHPAYLLRNLPDKARAWEDLCLARELMRVSRS
jgi:uracil-DNA glycosylase family 4